MQKLRTWRWKISMVHGLILLKCKNGHPIGIGYDSNECGCHHNGKPCLIIHCKNCFEDSLKTDKINTDTIEIPLDEEGAKIVKELISSSKQNTNNGGETHGTE